jgi:lysylphosphatidylglycerol synthetase-like protein (DUF2156 family)
VARREAQKVQRSLDLHKPFTQLRLWLRDHQHVNSVRYGVACAIALQGILNGLIVLLPPHRLKTFYRGLLEYLAPFAPMTWIQPFFSISRNMALLLGFFLIIVAAGLAHGKKQAWYLACILLPLSALVHLARGSGPLGLIVLLGLFLIILTGKRFFLVRSDPWHMRQGLWLLGIGGLLFMIYSLSGVYLLQDQFFLSGRLEDLLKALLLRGLHIRSEALVPLTGQARWFLHSLSYLSDAILLTGLFFLLRPISRRWWTSRNRDSLGQSRLRAVEMVRLYGEHTLSFFALAPQNLPYVSPQDKGLVHYQLNGKVATVLGDPVCPSEAFEGVTRSFLDLCHSNDWQVAFYQAQSEHLESYKKLGLHAFKIGEEAIVDLSSFTLNGSAMANVRCTCRRAERENIRIEWYEGVPPEEIHVALQAISDAWLTQKTGKRPSELGFSMGRFSELDESAKRADVVADQHQPNKDLHYARSQTPRFTTGVAFTQEGQACAFITFAPRYGSQATWGWAVDLIRRLPDAPPGAIELLLVKAIERFRMQNATTLSLGMVALSDINQEMSPIQSHLVCLADKHSHLLKSHRTLFHFKKKFCPRWESRYIVTDSALLLPRAVFALLQVHQTKALLAPTVRRRIPLRWLPRRY